MYAIDRKVQENDRFVTNCPIKRAVTIVSFWMMSYCDLFLAVGFPSYSSFTSLKKTPDQSLTRSLTIIAYKILAVMIFFILFRISTYG